jgi:hypothetical protein
VAPVFVAEGKSEEKIFDGRQPDSLKVGRSSRTDTFEVLKWSLEKVCGHNVRLTERGTRTRNETGNWNQERGIRNPDY